MMQKLLLHYYKYDIKMILFKTHFSHYEIVLEFMGHSAMQNPRTLSSISLSHPLPFLPLSNLSLSISAKWQENKTYS